MSSPKASTCQLRRSGIAISSSVEAGFRRAMSSLDHRLVGEDAEGRLVALPGHALPPGVQLAQDREAARRQVAAPLMRMKASRAVVGLAPAGLLAPPELLLGPVQRPFSSSASFSRSRSSGRWAVSVAAYSIIPAVKGRSAQSARWYSLGSLSPR
jgi:hypothetical protein